MSFRTLVFSLGIAPVYSTCGTEEIDNSWLHFDLVGEHGTRHIDDTKAEAYADAFGPGDYEFAAYDDNGNGMTVAARSGQFGGDAFYPDDGEITALPEFSTRAGAGRRRFMGATKRRLRSTWTGSFCMTTPETTCG